MGSSRDIRARSEFFSDLSPQYIGAAQVTLSRFLTYLRFKKGQDSLWGGGDEPIKLSLHPTWTDEEGTEIYSGILSATSTMIGTHLSPWHVHPLERNDMVQMESFLIKEDPIPLHRAIVAQAKDAAIAGNLRRAVIELAIACEVAIKQAFFSTEHSASAEALFAWLEEKRKINVTPLDLIRGPAKSAFGESFQEFDADRLKQIDHLFRCRNKIVHRGRLYYRDDENTTHIPDKEQVRLWLDSSLALMDWLEGQGGLSATP